MTVYFLLAITVVLTGVAALQLFYLGFLERASKRQQGRIRELEKYVSHLSHRLNTAEDCIIQHTETIQTMEYAGSEIVESDDVWADVIEDA